MANTEVNSLIAHIRDLIAADDLEEAIKEMYKLFKGSPLLDEAMILSSRYNAVTKKIRRGTIDFEKSELAKNIIRENLLDLLSFTMEETKKDPNISEEVQGYAKQYYNHQSTVTGDGNQVFQGINHSNINVQNLQATHGGVIVAQGGKAQFVHFKFNFSDFFGYLPQYLGDLMKVVKAPFEFLQAEMAKVMSETGKEEIQLSAVQKAVYFLAFSFILNRVIVSFLNVDLYSTQNDFIEDSNFFISLIKNTIFYLLIIALCGVSIRIAWRLVGVKSTLVQTMVPYAYIAGVAAVFNILVMFVKSTILLFDYNATGILKNISKLEWDSFVLTLKGDKIQSDILTQEANNLKETIAPTIELLSSFDRLSQILLLVWFILAWRIYRYTFNQSEGKSMLAGCLLTVVGSLIVIPIIIIVLSLGVLK